jgi:hypothetical protein
MQVQTKIQIIAKFRINEVLRFNRFTSSGRLSGREQLTEMEPSRWPLGMGTRRELLTVGISEKKIICVCRFGLYLFRPLSKRKCLTAHHMHVILYVYTCMKPHQNVYVTTSETLPCVKNVYTTWNVMMIMSMGWDHVHNVKRDDDHVDGVRPRTQRETWWCSCRWGETTYITWNVMMIMSMGWDHIHTWNVMMIMSMGWDHVHNVKRDDVHVDGVRPHTQRETWWWSCRWGETTYTTWCSCRWGETTYTTWNVMMIMSMGWDHVSELLPPRGLFFIPHVTWVWRTIVECYRQGKTPDSSTRTLWQFYQ